jgi:dipeptidyl aminopeptidase/acylaminoacyl peptidase
VLVIHGGKDYRVDPSEGYQVFTALRRQGVPARFLYFPDEGHWVLKPLNAELWWKTVHEWLAEYLQPDALP